MKVKAKKEKTTIQDAIKAIQDSDMPPAEKSCKHKKSVKSTNSELIANNLVTPKPKKKNHKLRAPTTEPEDDLPAPPKCCATRIVLTDDDLDGVETEKDLPLKRNWNKGKGKPIQQEKTISANQGGNIPKL